MERDCSEWFYSELNQKRRGTFVLNSLSFLHEMRRNGAQDPLHHGQMFLTVVGLKDKPV